MGAPVVPQHRNEVLHKMLRGLEDDSLTVSDVLGVLETELRSGAPAAAPLSEQFERWIGPQGSGNPGLPQGGRNRSPGPLQTGTPLLGPAPNALVNAPRSQGRPPNLDWHEAGERAPGHVILGCARCAVLESQVKALAQSLSGLGARMFNWSLAHCKENNERNGLWHLIVKYLQPVMTVDERISETCTGLLAAVGTSGGDKYVASEVVALNKPRAGAQGRAGSAPRSASPGPVWQPPGLSASAAGAGGFASPGRSGAGGGYTAGGGRSPGGRSPKFAENPVHMALNPEQASSPSSLASFTHDPQAATATKPGRSFFRPSAVAESFYMREAEAATPSSPSRGPSSPVAAPLKTAPTSFSPKSGPDPATGPSTPNMASAFQEYSPLATELTVRFGASTAAKKLNGVYQLVPGQKANGRHIYASGKRNIVYLSDGTWVIKLGPDADLDADVFAYVRDEAQHPHRVSKPWNVAADWDGFVVDARGAVTPGRSETTEAIAAASEKAAKLAGEGFSPAGVKAEVALMDRSDREELQKFRFEAHKKTQGLEPEEVLHDQTGAARLKIKIIKAQGLRKADLLSASDAFVICEVPGKGQVSKTPVVSDSQNPVWNHLIDTRYTPGDKLKLSVWDQDSATKNDLLCEVVLKPSHFYPGGFRGELALKEHGKETKATLEVTIDVVEVAPDPNAVDVMSPKEQRAAKQELFSLRGKIEAASAREKVLREKFDEEKAAREAAEEEVALEAARTFELLSHEAHIRQAHHQHSLEDSAHHEADVEDDPEVAEFRAAFDKHDKDATGKISLDDLSELMSDLGWDMYGDELHLMVDRAEEEGEHLDFYEFLHFIDSLNAVGGDDLAKYELMFSKLDPEDSGFITHEAVVAIIDATGEEHEHKMLDRALDEHDRQGTGHISWDEFMKLIQRLENGDLVANQPEAEGTVATLDLVKQKAVGGDSAKLSASDKKRVEAYLNRRGFSVKDELSKAVNQSKKTGFMKKGYEYPLHTAAVDNISDMVHLLLLSGADRSLKNSDGKTAVQAATAADGDKGTHKRVLEMLHDERTQSQFLREAPDLTGAVDF